MPALVDTVELLVNVEDVNDEPPVFGVDSYVVELDEGEDHPNFVTFYVSSSPTFDCAILAVSIFMFGIHLSMYSRPQMLMQHLQTTKSLIR